MEKFTYKLTTLSSLIVSPRDNFAFYEGIKEGGFSQCEIKSDLKCFDKGKLKVIYPFYRYGEYVAFSSDSTEYYLPGTSIKGVLAQERLISGGFMVDDVPIPSKNIVVRNLTKAQYLKDKDTRKATFDIFLKNIGVEMVKADTELTGDFFIKDRDAADTQLRAATALTIAKIKQMIAYLCELEKCDYKNEFLCDLRKIKANLSPLVKATDIFLFGGYKGLLHSINIKTPSQKNEGAIYVDRETMLPHGLVKIELLPDIAEIL